MRFLLFILIVLLMAYAWWPEQEPAAVVETFIGDQIAPLKKAEQFQQEDHLRNLQDHREKMDAQVERDGG